VRAGDDLPRDDDDEGAAPVAPDVRPRLPEPADEAAPFLRVRRRPRGRTPTSASAPHAHGGAPAPPGPGAGEARRREPPGAAGPRRPRHLAGGGEARGG